MGQAHDLIDECVRAIDAANANDPLRLGFDGRSYPLALLGGRNTQAWVDRLREEAPWWKETEP